MIFAGSPEQGSAPIPDVSELWLIVRVSVFVTLLAVARMVAVVDWLTAVVLTWKPLLISPLGIVNAASTVALGLFEVMATFIPPAGAFPITITACR